MELSEREQGAPGSAEERRTIARVCHEVLFPFIERLRRALPFNKGVLTAIRPFAAPRPVFEVPPFSPFAIAARFEDPNGQDRARDTEILSLVHTLEAFQLNVLLVAHRQASVYRYGLVLEADLDLQEAWVRTVYRRALEQQPLEGLQIEYDPSRAVVGHEGFGVVFEAYRTLVAQRYVKFYFRNL